MEGLFDIDWGKMFIPGTSILEVFIRGTVIYLGIFFLLRFFRRQAGSVSVADLIVIVVIADAAQNGMAGDAKSVVEALLLIVTILLWDYLIDWLGFRSALMAKVLEHQPLTLIKNGRFLIANMEAEMLTEDEVLAQLRQHGVDHVSEVKECRLESGGDFSVIKKSGKADHRGKKKKGSTA